MRGLFITPAAHPGQGSQLVAHAGDQLMLQARVYNYSLKAMDPNTTVHVRFYGQEWDHTTNSVPVGPIGNSFLIGEATLGPIPPFNTDTDNPNWVLASLPTGTVRHHALRQQDPDLLGRRLDGGCQRGARERAR